MYVRMLNGSHRHFAMSPTNTAQSCNAARSITLTTGSSNISADLQAQLGWCQCCDSVEWEGGHPLKAGGLVGEGVPAAPHG